MKKLLPALSIILCTTGLFCNTLFAQQYTVSSIPYNPVPYDSGIAVVSPVDDLWGQVLGIGFDFNFFGQNKQTLIVGTNGIITFDSSLANMQCPWYITPANTLPSTTLPNTIMFPYQDVDISLGGTVRHQVFGSPPNRRFVVSFDSVPYYDNSQGACGPNFPPFTGQVILYEGSNNIDMFIQDKGTCTGWNGGLAIMGIQNANGTEAYTVPGRNNTVWSANNEGWRFTNSNLPAQTPNRISGRVFADGNGNCAFDGSDYGLRNKPVIFHNNGTGSDSYIYTDMLGYYSKLADTGSYTFTTSNLANSYYTTNCPVAGSYTVNFAAYNDSADNQNFADTAADYCAAQALGLWVYGEEGNFAALGTCDTAYIQLSYHNAGTVTDSVTLHLTLNDSTRLLQSPVAYTTLAGNQYLFDIGNFAPGADTTITIMMSIGCDTIGTQYCFALDATGNFATHCLGYYNHAATCRQIGVPFDPNAMYVSSFKHSATGSTQRLTTENDDNFTYTVTFQNTGTAVAHNVRLLIPLSAKINAQTLSPNIASAAYSWLVLNNQLMIDFTGINLPDSNANEAGSHGFINFYVQQQTGNLPGDSFLHQAAIYFDYNSAVLTNQAIVNLADTTGVISSVSELKNAFINLYPNPANQTVTITAPVPAEIKVCDLTGRVIVSQKITETQSTLDVSGWSKGIYVVTVSNQKAICSLKLVKD